MRSMTINTLKVAKNDFGRMMLLEVLLKVGCISYQFTVFNVIYMYMLKYFSHYHYYYKAIIVIMKNLMIVFLHFFSLVNINCPVLSFEKNVSKLNPNKDDLWQRPRVSFSLDGDVIV